jgi:hypothetical protein
LELYNLYFSPHCAALTISSHALAAALGIVTKDDADAKFELGAIARGRAPLALRIGVALVGTLLPHAEPAVGQKRGSAAVEATSSAASGGERKKRKLKAGEGETSAAGAGAGSGGGGMSGGGGGGMSGGGGGGGGALGEGDGEDEEEVDDTGEEEQEEETRERRGGGGSSSSTVTAAKEKGGVAVMRSLLVVSSKPMARAQVRLLEALAATSAPIAYFLGRPSSLDKSVPLAGADEPSMLEFAGVSQQGGAGGDKGKPAVLSRAAEMALVSLKASGELSLFTEYAGGKMAGQLDVADVGAWLAPNLEVIRARLKEMAAREQSTAVATGNAEVRASALADAARYAAALKLVADLEALHVDYPSLLPAVVFVSPDLQPAHEFIFEELAMQLTAPGSSLKALCGFKELGVSNIFAGLPVMVGKAPRAATMDWDALQAQMGKEVKLVARHRAEIIANAAADNAGGGFVEEFVEFNPLVLLSKLVLDALVALAEEVAPRGVDAKALPATLYYLTRAFVRSGVLVLPQKQFDVVAAMGLVVASARGAKRRGMATAQADADLSALKVHLLLPIQDVIIMFKAVKGGGDGDGGGAWSSSGWGGGSGGAAGGGHGGGRSRGGGKGGGGGGTSGNPGTPGRGSATGGGGGSAASAGGTPRRSKVWIPLFLHNVARPIPLRDCALHYFGMGALNHKFAEPPAFAWHGLADCPVLKSDADRERYFASAEGSRDFWKGKAKPVKEHVPGGGAASAYAAGMAEESLEESLRRAGVQQSATAWAAQITGRSH